MAHFAKIGLDNEVLDIVVVDNIDTMTPQGIEDEAIGVTFLRNLTGHLTWVQTSYNGNIRKRFAGIGYHYDSDRDEFVPPGWVLDPDEGWIDPNPTNPEWPVNPLGEP